MSEEWHELRRLRRDLATRREAGLERRRRTVDGPCGPRPQVDGRPLLAFASNDYLGLAGHPRVAQAASAAALRYGVGAGASHLISGHHVLHDALEQRLAHWTGLPRTLFFSTGYMANAAVLSVLAQRHGEIFADRLNHASLNDGARLARARLVRYAHGDLAQLERLLAASRAACKIVATDAVFSMDGDIAPLPELLALCERYDAWLYVDDAHGFGVLGEGRGTLAHFRLASPRIVYMATLGKAAGVAGAFVAGAEAVIETLLQQAHSYVYTTAQPPLLAAALLAALDVMAKEPQRRAALMRGIDLLRSTARPRRGKLLESSTPIQPLVLGDAAAAIEAAEQLGRRGIWVPAIRPPTVPPGTARLRISLSAAHDEADVLALCEALNELA